MSDIEDQDHWDFYFTRVNERQASIFVNLSIRPLAPILNLPHLLWVWVQLEDVGPHGMGQGKDAEVLLSIEASLVNHMTTCLGALPVGRIRTDGRFEFYLYAPSAADLESAVRTALEPWPRRAFTFGEQLDAEWAQYRELLFPTPAEMQCIQNRHVVEALKEEGDPLREPREVDHWAFFADEETQGLFRSRADSLGFDVIHVDRDDERDELPYVVQLRRVDKVDWGSINSVTLELFHIARELGGVYDGWEAAVRGEG